MSPRDPSSVALSLDDHAESMKRESLDFGISSVMEALNQAGEVMRRVFVPTTRYRLDLPRCFLLSSYVFVFFELLILVSFCRLSLLVAGINLVSSVSKRWSGTALAKRPGYEQI